MAEVSKMANVSSMAEIFSIGHSTLTYADFVARLKAERVNAVADVRSAPRSQRVPHFDQSALQDALASDDIAYVFLGKELGGRPAFGELYSNGVADYDMMAKHPLFQEGVARIETGAGRYRIAMMCSESDPLACHRCLLVGRELKARGNLVRHIISSDRTVDQDMIEAELLRRVGALSEDMFASRDHRIANAYREQSRKVAFSQTGLKVQRQLRSRKLG